MNEQVFSEHHEAVRAFARRLAGNDADADDLVSATFEELPKAMAYFESRSSMRSFLLGICANLWRRMQRSFSRRERLHGEVGFSEATDADTLDRHVAAQQLAAKLARALSGLPEEQRVAFMLVAVEERSAAEVATLCGVPEATIRSRVFHARKKIQAELAEKDSRPLLSPAALPWMALFFVLFTGCAVLVSPVGRPLRVWLSEKIELIRTIVLGQAQPIGAREGPLARPALADERNEAPEISPPRSESPGAEQIASWRTAERSRPVSHAAADVQVPSFEPVGKAPRSAERSSPASDAHAQAPLTEEVLVERPDMPEDLSSALLELSALSAAPKWDPSVELYRRAHQLYVEQRRYADALLAWDSYLDQYPSGSLSRDARFNRALTLARLGRFAQAAEALAPFARGEENGFHQQDAQTLLEALKQQVPD